MPGGTSNSINLLTGTPRETEYGQNKRGSWAKLIGRDPFTALASNPEQQPWKANWNKQIAVEKFFQHSAVATEPVTAGSQRLGNPGMVLTMGAFLWQTFTFYLLVCWRWISLIFGRSGWAAPFGEESGGNKHFIVGKKNNKIIFPAPSLRKGWSDFEDYPQEKASVPKDSFYGRFFVFPN